MNRGSEALEPCMWTMHIWLDMHDRLIVFNPCRDVWCWCLLVLYAVYCILMDDWELRATTFVKHRFLPAEFRFHSMLIRAAASWLRGQPAKARRRKSFIKSTRVDTCGTPHITYGGGTRPAAVRRQIAHFLWIHTQRPASNPFFIVWIKLRPQYTLTNRNVK